MSTPNATEIATVAIESRTGELADNVTDNIPLLDRLREKENIKFWHGGRVIYQEIEFEENPSYKRYLGWEQLNMSIQPVFTAAEFEPKQAAIAIQMSGLEELQTSGEEGIIDLLSARMRNAERTFKNAHDSDIRSDGTADGGKQIGGLEHLIATTPTGTVGNINANTFTFWRNLAKSAATDYGIASLSSANIQRAMNRVQLALTRGGDAPDYIDADDNLFLMYFESLTPGLQQMGNKRLLDKRVRTVPFMGADVVSGGGQGGHAQASKMRFLNTNYIFYRPHSRRNLVPIGGERVPLNQDGMAKYLAWAGNMTTSNRSLQGVLGV